MQLSSLSLAMVHSTLSLAIAGGNPLSVVKKQLGLKMSKIRRRCPLYFTTGKLGMLNA